jgi:hypothetical protein
MSREIDSGWNCKICGAWNDDKDKECIWCKRYKELGITPSKPYYTSHGRPIR